MPSALLNDDAIWGLPGAKVAEPRKGAETFCETPLWELLCQGAAHDPDAVALVGRSGALRYGDLLRIAQNTAAALAERIAPGEAVACLLPRHPEAIAALLGCLISGRVCLIIDPANPALRQRDLLMDLAPAALLLAEMPPLRYDAPALMLADVLAGPDRIWRPDAAPDPDAPLSVHMTSGSSGRPKGIALSARSVLYRALSNLSDMRLTRADCFVMPSGPFAGAGLSALIGALACGARCVLTSFAEDGAGTTLRLIERERVTCAVFQPPMLRVLLSLERAPAAFAAMRCVRIGAAGLARADLVALRRSLPPDCAVWHTYASTEALFVASWQIPPDDSRPGDDRRCRDAAAQPRLRIARRGRPAGRSRRTRRTGLAKPLSRAGGMAAGACRAGPHVAGSEPPGLALFSHRRFAAGTAGRHVATARPR